MKFSEQWLREWVNPELDTQALAEQLTNSGLEVDSITPVADEFSHVYIAEVIDVRAHPATERLRVCQVDVGQTEQLQIVTNLTDIKLGLKTALAMPGAKLPNGVDIKPSKLRGVESQGMFCGKDSLGLEENSQGVWVLPQDAPVGHCVRDYLQLNDVSIDVELTANRGDCLSIQGIAREVAVANRCDYQSPMMMPVKATIENQHPIDLLAEQDCPRYLGRIIRGINNQVEIPLWMQEKLRRCGLRSISPVVDVTNYVMLELGQPMHAFDFAKLQGTIQVRKAKEDERLTLLDGQTVTLSEDTLVIADPKKALAMAGIMGGEASAVNEITETIFLESAFFNPLSIMGKARYYGLHTDSSHRFERGVDVALPALAMERATDLLLKIVGGEAGPITTACAESYLPTSQSIVLRSHKIEQLLGCTIDNATVETVLQHLKMQVTVLTDQQWQVIPPSHRFDITIEADLIEEIARIYGYNNIPTQAPRVPLIMLPQSSKQVSLTALRSILQQRDYHEVMSYSFADIKIEELLNPQHIPYALSNPISPELSVMRSSLWCSLLPILQHNLKRQQTRVRLFEVGLRFVNHEQGLQQIPSLAGMVCGDHLPEQWGAQPRSIDFYDIKSDVEALVVTHGIPEDIVFESTEKEKLHPGRSVNIVCSGQVLGYVGALHPKITQQLGLPEVYGFELDLEPLRQTQVPVYQSTSKFPSVRRDIALLVDETVEAQTIVEAIRQNAGNFLSGLILFDVYQGQTIELGKKSLALGLVWQHPQRTLTDKEINRIIDKVIQQLAEDFGASLRD